MRASGAICRERATSPCQSGRRGPPAPLVLLGRPRPDRRSRADAGDRAAHTASTSTLVASTRSGARWAGRRRCSSSRAIPRLLAGAAAFDPATDMARRYRDFAHLSEDGTAAAARARGDRWHADPGARRLRASGAPTTTCERSPISRRAAAALLEHPRPGHHATSGDETGAARARTSSTVNPRAQALGLRGGWVAHRRDAATARLPRALARFGLLPWSDVPALPVRPAPALDRLTSAVSRSAIRSSADSIPTDSRTRLRAARTARRRSRRGSSGPGARSGSRRRRATRRAGRASCARRASTASASDSSEEGDHPAEVAHLTACESRGRDATAGRGRAPARRPRARRGIGHPAGVLASAGASAVRAS